MASAATRKQASGAFKAWGKRDPELYVLLGTMSGIFGVAGYFFGRKGTNLEPEKNVLVAGGKEGERTGGMPWESDATNSGADFKYKYHPGGDPRNAPKEAPSALHTVIKKGVTLPAELHEKFNKAGQ